MSLLRIGVLGLCLLCGIAALAAGGTTAKPVFEMGASQETALKILGKPTNFSERDEAGKEIWYYNSATVTFLNGQIIGWRGFLEKLPDRPADAPPIRLGSTKTDVLGALGFPPTALRYQQALHVGKRPCGEEEWQYSVGVIVFQGDLVVGWRNVTTPVVMLGALHTGAPGVTAGSSAKAVLDFAGTPPTLACYTDNGDELWMYPDGQLFLRGGKVIWMGPYQKPDTTPETNPANPPTPKPPDDVPAAPQKEDRGFVGEPDFGVFRVAYQPMLQQMVARTPKITYTSYYQGMSDCINGVPWWSISAQMAVDTGYAQGVKGIFDAYQQYLAQKKRTGGG